MTKRGTLPPPPQLRDNDFGSIRQGIQWLMDRVYHLDDCLDKTQEELKRATSVMQGVVSWQENADEAVESKAIARAERRRMFHYVYIGVDFVDRNGWKLVGTGAVIYGLLK